MGELPDLLLSEAFALADLVIELATRHIIQDKDNAVLLLIDFVDVDDAGMVQPHQHLQFVPSLHQKALIYLGCEDLRCIPADDFPDC